MYVALINIHLIGTIKNFLVKHMNNVSNFRTRASSSSEAPGFGLRAVGTAMTKATFSNV